MNLIKRLEPTDKRKNELDILRDAAEQVTTDLIGKRRKGRNHGKRKTKSRKCHRERISKPGLHH